MSVDSPEKPQDTIQDCQWMWRASGDVQVNRENSVHALVNLGAAGKGPAADCAGADRNDDLRVRDGVVGLQDGVMHVPRNGACNQEPIRMARGGGELNAEPGEIPADGIQHVGVEVAGVAASRADFAQSKRTAENAKEVIAHPFGEFQFAAG